MSRKLKMLGFILLFIGLITGLIMTTLKNPRMGLSAHLEGILNGLLLVITGLIWNEVKISESLKKMTFITLIYGTYVNWLTTLLAACLGTSKMTPITGHGFAGQIFNEQLVNAGFISVGIAMIFSVAVIIFGLRGKTNNIIEN
jgi:hydroxylaminobenzene mutase